MLSQSFTTTFRVDQSPEEAFAAINNVRGWWTGGDIDGGTDTLGEEFTYRVPHVHYSRQHITQLVPGKKVVWRVLDAYLNCTEDPHEWTGTEIAFEISRDVNQTKVREADLGLVPEFECFDACSNAWGSLVNGNLRKLISSGKSQASPFATKT